MSVYIPSQITPEKVRIVVDDKELEVFRIEISGDEYFKCEEFSQKMWANSKQGEWGRGLINDPSDRAKAERTGLLGEMAFAKIFNIPINLDYADGGEDTDFILFRHDTIDVKSATYNYGVALLKAETNTGRSIQQKNDVYVFSYLEKDDAINKHAFVIIVGYEYRETILSKPKVPARKGNHKNYELSYAELKPIKILYEDYKIFRNLP